MAQYGVGEPGTCPHCETTAVFDQASNAKTRCEEVPSSICDDGGATVITWSECPHCRRLVIALAVAAPVDGVPQMPGGQMLAWPIGASSPVPMQVPEDIAADYQQAAGVLDLSPNASAALSRRCLQAVLGGAGGARQSNLSKQIEHVLPALPSYLSEEVHAIRIIGNFAAHPNKDKATGEIVDQAPPACPLPTSAPHR